MAKKMETATILGYIGSRALGYKGLGFRALGYKGLGFKALGFRV